jgi:hypothetical protein
LLSRTIYNGCIVSFEKMNFFVLFAIVFVPLCWCVQLETRYMWDKNQFQTVTVSWRKRPDETYNHLYMKPLNSGSKHWYNWNFDRIPIVMNTETGRYQLTWGSINIADLPTGKYQLFVARDNMLCNPSKRVIVEVVGEVGGWGTGIGGTDAFVVPVPIPVDCHGASIGGAGTGDGTCDVGCVDGGCVEACCGCFGIIGNCFMICS